MQPSRQALVGFVVILGATLAWNFWPKPQQTIAPPGPKPPTKVSRGEPAKPLVHAVHGASASTRDESSSLQSPPAMQAQVAYVPASAAAPPQSFSRPRNWVPGNSRPINPGLAPPAQEAPWKNKSGTAAPIRRRKAEDRKRRVAAEARQKRLDRLKSKLSGRRLQAFDKRAEYLAKLKENKP